MTDLATLFAKDPLNYTHDDLAQVIAKLRESRHQFNAGVRGAGSTKPKSTKAKETSKLAEQLDLDIKL